MFYMFFIFEFLRQCLFVDPCDRPTAMELSEPLFGRTGVERCVELKTIAVILLAPHVF